MQRLYAVQILSWTILIFKPVVILWNGRTHLYLMKMFNYIKDNLSALPLFRFKENLRKEVASSGKKIAFESLFYQISEASRG